MAVAGAADAVVAAEVALALTGAEPASAGGTGERRVPHGAGAVVDGVVVLDVGVLLGAGTVALEAAAGGSVGTGDGAVDGVGHQFSPLACSRGVAQKRPQNPSECAM